MVFRLVVNNEETEQHEESEDKPWDIPDGFRKLVTLVVGHNSWSFSTMDRINFLIAGGSVRRLRGNSCMAGTEGLRRPDGLADWDWITGLACFIRRWYLDFLIDIINT